MVVERSIIFGRLHGLFRSYYKPRTSCILQRGSPSHNYTCLTVEKVLSVFPPTISQTKNMLNILCACVWLWRWRLKDGQCVNKAVRKEEGWKICCRCFMVSVQPFSICWFCGGLQFSFPNCSYISSVATIFPCTICLIQGLVTHTWTTLNFSVIHFCIHHG